MCSAKWLEHVCFNYVINVRSGPFDRDDSFTTMTIVINRINVIKINVYILCAVYSLISWCDFAGVSGIVLFININVDLVIKIISEIVFMIGLLVICCWFGDVAVK